VATPRWYFDDLKPGQVFTAGSRAITRDEIIAFAREFDPQPFHLDDDAAKASIYGGLLASGWHTAAILMRLLYEAFVKDAASMGSPGVDELRWLKPVRPGDTLTARFTILEAIPSRSKPDRGIVRSLSEVLNQRGEVVLTAKGMSLLKRRPQP